MSDRVPHLIARLQGFGTTIFAEMSALAVRTGSINLGQGFPDTDGPAVVADAAVEAIRAGHNQYPPGPGVPELRAAVVRHHRRFYGLEFDADREVLVTAGATEAIAAAMLSLCEVGDEVLTFEPYYDSYAAAIAMAGAQRRVVTLRPPDYHFDPDALAAAVGPRTRLLLLNSPHNPTGKVFSRAELEQIARLCVEHDLLAVTDEVYEHLVYDGEPADLSEYKGKALLVVNVASKCGLTPQYEGLENLHEKYGARGFEVLGFPCNQFMGQEPGTAEEIREFCDTNYHVQFPLFEKIDVNGDNQHPIYAELEQQADADGEAGDVKWNFEKFLVSPEGKVVGRFRPQVTPEDPALVQAIEAQLPS